MQNTKKLLAIIFLFVGLYARSQDQAVIQNYIETYRDVAIAEMQRTGVPASIKLAQGIHETLAGTSDLVIQSNNHFGIKCKNTWKGESVTHDDDARGECFRKYKSPVDSYRDHSDFLKSSPRYASLFELDPLNYTAWAYGLKKAGYATNPRYPQIIVKLIEDYHLQDYTLIALGKKQPVEETYAKVDVEKTETVPIAAVEKTEVGGGPNVTMRTVDYPNGEFKINETKVIYAQRGTAFLSIAQLYSISLARLFEFNDLTEKEALSDDQLIYLQRKRKTGNNEFHTVKPGETLYDIAQEEGIRLGSLLEYNQLQSSMQPATGQQLYLRASAPSRPELVKVESKPAQTTIFKKENTVVSVPSPVQTKKTAIAYKVKPKETIYAISKKYNVRIDEIVQWNQLTSYDLKNGQQLRIYK